MAAAAAGLVLIMTGCSPMAAGAPHGDALYTAAKQHYTSMADTMHKVLMAVHEGVWSVSPGGYGAFPRSCDLSVGTKGYRFTYRRSIQLADIDPQSVTRSAAGALRAAGMAPDESRFGTGDAAEWNVIAEDESLGRVVVTIRPGAGDVQVALDGICLPGDSHDVSALVSDEEHDDGRTLPWQRLPPTEGPDSVPQFYFPADGAVYFNEDGSLAEPQPTVAPEDLPKAPYGG